MNDSRILSITQLNLYVKGMLESDVNLSNIYVCGEISNFTNHYKSGHFYLTLKDEKAAVKAVMFRSSAQKIVFTPENGMKVICRGRVSLFERDGSYQFYIDDMQPDGVGALQIAFEQLKARLSEAGLFDPTFKKPIPKIPERIAVITSPTGAALQDILNIISRRFPLAEIIICPVLVQGELAAPSLTDAVEHVNELNCADVIIIGRGGGSIEDLWAFNNEKLAYAIFNSHIPVISAVGHETDYTICDFVADLRAPTPSAAAELAVPDAGELSDYLIGCFARIKNSCRLITADCENKLKALSDHPILRSPDAYFDHISEQLDMSEKRITSAFERIVSDNTSSLCVLSAKIDALSPLKTLARGYSIAKNRDGDIIRSADGVEKGSSVSIVLSDGSLDCTVNNVYTE